MKQVGKGLNMGVDPYGTARDFSLPLNESL